MTKLNNGLSSWEKVGKDLIDHICNEIPLKDLPWDGGDFDYKEFVNRYKKYMKITEHSIGSGENHV